MKKQKEAENWISKRHSRDYYTELGEETYCEYCGEATFTERFHAFTNTITRNPKEHIYSKKIGRIAAMVKEKEVDEARLKERIKDTKRSLEIMESELEVSKRMIAELKRMMEECDE